MMLAKSDRLTRTQFAAFFKTGKRHHTPHLTVVYSPHEKLHASVVVGKKVAKQATVRNTLRRRLYGVLYRELKTTGQTGIFIVLPKPSFATLPRKTAAQEVIQLIARVAKKA